MPGTELALLLVDAVERGFAYALIALAARLVLIATAPARLAPEALVADAVPIAAGLVALAPASLAGRWMPAGSPLTPLVWSVAAGVTVLVLGLLRLSHHGRVWRAMLVDVKALTRAGIGYGGPALSAGLLGLTVSALGGAAGRDGLPQELAGWLPLAALLVLMVERRIGLLLGAVLALAGLEALIAAWRGAPPPAAVIALIILVPVLWRGRGARLAQARP